MRINYILLITFIGLVFLEPNICLGRNLSQLKSSGTSENPESTKKGRGILDRIKKFFGIKSDDQEELEQSDKDVGSVSKHDYDFSIGQESSRKSYLGSDSDYSESQKGDEFEESKSDKSLKELGAEDDSVGDKYPQTGSSSEYGEDLSAPIPRIELRDYKEETADSAETEYERSRERYPEPKDSDLEEGEEESKRDSLVEYDDKKLKETKIVDSGRIEDKDLLSIYDEKSGPSRGIVVYSKDDSETLDDLTEIPRLSAYLESEEDKELSKLSTSGEKTDKSLSLEKSIQENILDLAEKSPQISEKVSSESEKSRQKDNHYESSYDNAIDGMEDSISEYKKKSEDSLSELPHETYDRLIREAMQSGLVELSEKTKPKEEKSKSESKYGEIQEKEKTEDMYGEEINFSNYSERYPRISQGKDDGNDVSEEEADESAVPTLRIKKLSENVLEDLNTENIDDESEKVSEISEKAQDTETSQRGAERSSTQVLGSDKSASTFANKFRTMFNNLKVVKSHNAYESKGLSEKENLEHEDENVINDLSLEHETDNVNNLREKLGYEGSQGQSKETTEGENPDESLGNDLSEYPNVNEGRVKMLIRHFENENKVSKPTLIVSPRNKLGIRDTEKSSPEKKSIDSLINFFEYENIKNRNEKLIGMPLSSRNRNKYLKKEDSADNNEQQKEVLLEKSSRYTNKLGSGYSESKEYSDTGYESEHTAYDKSVKSDLDLEDIVLDQQSTQSDRDSNSEVSDESLSFPTGDMNRKLFNVYSTSDGIEYSVLSFPNYNSGELAGGLEWAFNLGKSVCNKSDVLLSPKLYPTLEDGIVKSPMRQEKQKLMQTIDSATADEILDLVLNILDSK
ncbi:signal peptide containing protein [Cryptosporidium ryanae]|uniref:signal peptide containing protein n=1 Tax=Cryptosporidium ryanae TaxID=515981 RepID=UPI00351A533E|nr:signal peptide containing protein [Cryptosporidium ryanae]